MKIREIDFASKEWNNIISNFELSYVYFRKEYLEASIREDGQQPTLFVAEDDSNHIIAVNVMIKRDIFYCKGLEQSITKGQYFDLISPYGYGGFVGNCDDFEWIWKEYTSYCAKKGYVCEVIKFHPLSHSLNGYLGNIEHPFHNVYIDLRKDEEVLWREFKPKVRKNINKATKNKVIAFCDKEKSQINDFLDIYYSTMKRNNATESYYFTKQYFEDLLLMNNGSALFFSKYNDVIISTEIVLYDANCCYSFLGGSREEYFDYRPNEILKFEIIKWAQKKGLHYFVLGGGYGKDDGIFNYKLSFAPLGNVDFCVGTNIFCRETYAEICQKSKKINADMQLDPKVPEYRF